MAKKAKQRNQGLPAKTNAPQAQTKTQSQSQVSKAGLLSAILQKTGITVEAELAEKLSDEQQSHLQLLMDTLAQKTKEQEAQTAQTVKTQALLEREQSQLQIDSTQLKQTQTQLAEQKAGLEELAHRLNTRSKQILDQEQSLLEREANAEAGFVKQRQASLAALKQQMQTLQAQIDEHEQKIQTQEVEYLTQRRTQEQEFKVQRQQQLAQEQLQLNEQHQALVKKEKQLEQKAGQIEFNKEKYLKELSEHKKAEQHKRHILEHELSLQQASRERDHKDIQQLQSQLLSYAELGTEAEKRQLNSPMEVIFLLDETEQALTEAREQLKGRASSDLEQALALCLEEKDRLSDENERLRQDYQRLRAQEAKYKLSNQEKVTLQAENEVMQLRTGTLKQAVEALKSDLDDLMDKQQSKQAFAVLKNMDNEFAEPPNLASVDSLKTFCDELQLQLGAVEKTPLYYDIKDIRMFVAGLAMSQLHILQGISGTGKTSLVKAFAKAVGGHVTTVPVQAGWRDKDDLIGHYNAFEKRYYEKECLQAIYRAHTAKYRHRFNLILLDEMNLSRPEQYFAEFLSALEMSEDEREVVLMEGAVLSGPEHFTEGRKIKLLNNTWFMGTANHDETTFEFADKTHDRAFLLDLARHPQPDGWHGKQLFAEPVDVRSLRALFEQAGKKHHNVVSAMLCNLKDSEFTANLGRDFNIGWGHRFESQAKHFITAYIACGGKDFEAMEHLLVSRVLRKGKVLGRFDSREEKLETLEKSLGELFDKFGGQCDWASEVLTNEILLKSEGVY